MADRVKKPLRAELGTRILPEVRWSERLSPAEPTGQADHCSWQQVILVAVANPEPFTPTEEMFWRALMRIVLTLPRQLHDDMVRAAGLTASEYTVIMNLSEAPNRQLRMADLASATGLSASRTTRLVDNLQVARIGRKAGQFRRRAKQPCRADLPRSEQAAVCLASPCRERAQSCSRLRPSGCARPRPRKR